MKKNVCIIHFNTPVLTAHLVKSINKHTPDTNIYIFDNSDKYPFVNTFDNVKVFDNTKGQIIRFDTWLKKYPNRFKSGGKTNNWGSAKHAYSVEKCMELIKEPFVLLDSDVLIRKDFTPLFDEIVCYKGEVICQAGTNNRIKRILPFICFINTPMCLKKNIHYFDENYMHGLKYKGNSDNYDTGAAMYVLTEKNKGAHREIKVADYIVHYGNGSWVGAAEQMKRIKHPPINAWLEKYKMFWDEDGEEEIKQEEKKKIMFKDVFDHIYCLHYLPAKDRLPKIKEELKRVGIDENADYFSWVYDYPSPILDMVYKNPDMKMSAALKNISREYVKHVSLKHYEIIKEAYSLGYKRILIMENDIRFHKDIAYISKMLENVPDTDIVMFDKMTSSMPGDSAKYNNYVKHLPENTLYGNMRETGVFFIFCSCYALNRKAMLRFIQTQENTLLPPDTPLNDNTLTGSFPVVNVAIQEPHLKTRKCESYSKINLSTSLYNTGMATEADGPSKRVIVIPKGDKTLAQNKTERKKIILPEKPERKQQITPPMLNMPVKKKKLIQTSDNKHIHRRRLDIKRTGYNRLYDIT